jgi:hypothetical protein
MTSPIPFTIFSSLDNYANFAYVVGIKSVMRILPVFLVPLLVPLGSPSDKSEVMYTMDSEEISSAAIVTNDEERSNS